MMMETTALVQDSFFLKKLLYLLSVSTLAHHFFEFSGHCVQE